MTRPAARRPRAGGRRGRDEQIADVVGLVALNLLTGAFNLVAGIHPTVPAAP